MHRAETTVTEPSDLAVKKITSNLPWKTVVIKTGFFSNSYRKSELSPESNQMEPTGRRIYSTLHYIQDISEKLRRAYKKAGVHTSFKPHKTLRQLLVAPKDKPPPDQLAGTVYCLECEDCHKCYIRESARRLGKRIKEHITTRSSSTLAVSEHRKTAKHHFDPDKVKILAREPKDFPEKSWKPSTSERRSTPSIETKGWIWIPYGIQFL